MMMIGFKKQGRFFNPCCALPMDNTTVRVSPSRTLVWVQTDSGHRDLKNILIAISSQTTSDPSWEASAW
jgi:hypothetical protein